MKISTKGRYALRLMLDLASNDSGTPIRLKDVAKRQGISEKYLVQKAVFARLTVLLKKMAAVTGKTPASHVCCGRSWMMPSVVW